MKKKQFVKPDDRILVRCVQQTRTSTAFLTSFRFLNEPFQSFQINTYTAPEWVPGKTYEMILRDAE